MANSKYAANTEAAKSRRKQAGAYIKQLRTDLDMTQRDLAEQLGLQYYTFVSQVEGGAARVPPDEMLNWAKALGVDGQLFSRKMLEWYDPDMFNAIFNSSSAYTKTPVKVRKVKHHARQRTQPEPKRRAVS